MMTSNVYTEYGDSQIPSPVKARMKAAQQRALNKALKDRETLFRQFKKWHREQSDKLRQGPYGSEVEDLIAFLVVMTPEQGTELVDLVKSRPWYDADNETKFQLLRLIDGHIAFAEMHRAPTVR